MQSGPILSLRHHERSSNAWDLHCRRSLAKLGQQKALIASAVLLSSQSRVRRLTLYLISVLWNNSCDGSSLSSSKLQNVVVVINIQSNRHRGRHGKQVERGRGNNVLPQAKTSRAGSGKNFDATLLNTRSHPYPDHNTTQHKMTENQAEEIATHNNPDHLEAFKFILECSQSKGYEH